MGKFGKKTVVSKNMGDYMIGIMAPSGFGKTTLMPRVCERLFGDDGYIILDMGMEDGTAAINDIVAERVDTFKKLKDVVDDIVKNKTTDYPNLKVLVFDTLDAYFELVEEYTIKMWNYENQNVKNFVPATSINSVEGGFGRGMDRVIDTAKKIVSKLESVGVRTWWTAHVKEKEQEDVYTGTTFTVLTANMIARYFNSFKNSTHVIGCGYYDRSIETKEIGKVDPITKKKKERSSIVEEARKIKFRDDAMIADGKSRFANIVDEINLDTDEFIDAIQNAIDSERKGGNASLKSSKPPVVHEEVKSTKETDPQIKEESEPITNSVEDDDPPFDMDEHEVEPAVDMIEYIRANFKELPKEVRTKIKEMRGERNLDDLDSDTLMAIVSVIKAELTIQE